MSKQRDINSFENFLTSAKHRGGHNISKETFERDKRMIKLLVYLLNVNMKLPARVISRFITIDKDTVPAWVKEVKSWPADERNAIVTELVTGRRLSAKDVLDDEYKKRPYKDEVPQDEAEPQEDQPQEDQPQD